MVWVTGRVPGNCADWVDGFPAIGIGDQGRGGKVIGDKQDGDALRGPLVNGVKGDDLNCNLVAFKRKQEHAVIGAVGRYLVRP